MINNHKVLDHSLFELNDNDHPILHAKRLDKLLGYNIPRIEVKLLQKYRAYNQYNDESNKKQHYKGTQAWIGLHPQILQTPYCDIYKAFSLIKEEVLHVVDIGAGYGRVGLVLSVLYPNAKFTGFEIVKQRQIEASRVFEKLELKKSKIILKNALDKDFEIPKADVYFIYDFSVRDDIFHILLLLSTNKQDKSFYLITKGDRVDYLMNNKFKNKWNIYKKLEGSELTIYTSKNI